MASAFEKGLFPDLEHPDMVEVGVGELATAQHPAYLMTAALGSCVGVCLYDSSLKRGGLAHVMLPNALESVMPGLETRFASFAVPELVRRLTASGSPKRKLVAKIAGGATMFSADSSMSQIGPRNVAEVKRQLELAGIPLYAEDTGERHARTIELRLDTGELVVRSYLYGVKRV